MFQDSDGTQGKAEPRFPQFGRCIGAIAASMITLGIIIGLMLATLAIPVAWVIAATWLLEQEMNKPAQTREVRRRTGALRSVLSWRAFYSSWKSDSRSRMVLSGSADNPVISVTSDHLPPNTV